MLAFALVWRRLPTNGGLVLAEAHARGWAATATATVGKVLTPARALALGVAPRLALAVAPLQRLGPRPSRKCSRPRRMLGNPAIIELGKCFRDASPAAHGAIAMAAKHTRVPSRGPSRGLAADTGGL